ncbi:MAG: hypothetical protein M1814_006443 [Vezdaea aestivalis]|nr:MAG: hypothetical protein M1814_006443 [Vezdaea aestivalis]
MKVFNFSAALKLLLLSSLSVKAAPAAIPDVTAIHALQARDPYTPGPAGRLMKINQKPQYFAGANSWWVPYLFDDAEIERVFQQMVQSGLRTTRIWGFGNTNTPGGSGIVYFQYLNSTGGYPNFDKKNGIPRLDKTIRLAEKYKINLVIPLLNNWDDLGGINTYVNAFGGDHNSFYTNAKAQQVYKDYVKLIVTRYKHSSAIFSWELANEPRCSGCPTSVITNWVKDISAYIKSLDSHHAVAIGDEGWLPNFGGPDTSYGYSSYEGVDFIANLAIPTIDYGTFHMYPQFWGYAYDWGNQWIKDHDAIGKRLGKPVILEEYGVESYVADRQAIILKYQQTILKETSVASSSFWQFGTQISSINPFDNFAIYYDTTPGSDYQTLVVPHVKDMAAKPPVTIT